METWGDLFAPRQALALTTFARLVREAYARMCDARGVGGEGGSTGLGLARPGPRAPDADFPRAVATCLALAVSNMSHYNAALSYNHPFYGIRSSFGGNGFPMKADFGEASPLIPRLVGGFDYALDLLAQVLEQEGEQGLRPGVVRQGSATAVPLPDGYIPYVVTDPPYYDAVPYAGLSDFCYAWLRRMLYDLHPDLFRLPLTPKAQECILDPGPPPPGEPEKTQAFFERTMEGALAECRRILRPDGLAVVLFAHKSTAGWEALLSALVRAGWTVTASWPIETERGARMRAKNSAVLASSVFLVCRPRPVDSGVGEWRVVLAEMNRRVGECLPRLEAEGIHGADAIFASLSPALEVYSRYERVETAGGEVIPLGDVRDGSGRVTQRGYLSYVWEAVAREALRLLFPEADAEGFEEDARVTALWLWTLRGRADGAPASAQEVEEEAQDEDASGKGAAVGWALPYDDARLMLQALGAQEAHLRRPGGILEVKGNSARLLSVAERRRFLLGTSSAAVRGEARRRGPQLALFESPAVEVEEAAGLPPGRTTLDRLHQAMLLFAAGQSAALRDFLAAGGVGQDVQFWRLADALSRLYPSSSAEKRWVDGLLVRRKSWANTRG